MKNILKLIGVAALVAVIGFTMIGCNNGTGGGGPSKPSTSTPPPPPPPPGYNTIDDFKTWLDEQPDNTAETPYDVKVNISNLGGASNTAGSLGKVLRDSTKYVNLDLSGSTFTSIGENAFAMCSRLTSITIGSGVTTIENSAFWICASLTAINVDAGNTAYSSQDGVLYNKAKTTFIHCPESITGTITIPNSITSIGNGVLYNCYNLTSITIGSGVTSIMDDAFPYSLTSITVDPGNNYYASEAGFLYNKVSGQIAHILPSGSSGNVTIPNGVTSIGEGAFEDCTGLTSITIPNSVTSIGDDAFKWCTSLTSITIPASVTSIGKDAFFVFSGGLTSVTFAEGSNILLANFGNGAFPPDGQGNLLRSAYLAASPKAGTYTRSGGWTKT
jgi:hypothetical protein